MSSRKFVHILALSIPLSLAACSETSEENDSGSPSSPANDPTTGEETKGGAADPRFAGEWSGTVLCEGYEESNGTRTPGQFQEQWYATFDDNGDLLLPSPGGPEAQTQAGQVTKYVPEGGGQGSRTLVSVERGENVRLYELLVDENRTDYQNDGYSETFDRRTVRVDEYTLEGDAMQAKIDLDMATDHYISGPNISGAHTKDRLVGTCTGKLTRTK